MSPVETIWQYFTDAKWHLRASALLSALTTMSTVALIATSGWLIARASQMPPVLELSIAIVGVRTFALLRSVTRYSERIISHNATFISLPRIRIALFNKLEELAPSGLAQFHRGDLMSRVVADVDDIQDLPLRIYLPIVSSAIAATFCVALVSWILPAAGAVLALALLVSATVVPRLTITSGQIKQDASANVRSQLNSSLLDYFEGLADITMLDARNDVFTQLDRTNDEMAKIESSFAARSGFATALIVMIQGLTISASVFAAFKAMEMGALSSINTVVIGLIPLAAFESVTALPNAMLNLSRVRGAADRLVEIIEASDPSPDSGTNEISETHVSMAGVTSRWPQSPSAAICEISFEVASGSTHALIGQSGSGKSSVIATLTKMLDYESGKVTIGGQSIELLSGESIRNALVATGHDAHIFATSIAENLRLASNTQVSDETIWKALEAVRLDEWIRSLTLGIDTVLGDQGTTVSGGQRQRLLLARLFISNPKVWIVDEPTEHLNSELADQVLASIRDAAGTSSLIFATHRLGDTSSNDLVTVLADGRAIEQGLQSDLAAHDGYFAQSLRHEQQAKARIGATE